MTTAASSTSKNVGLLLAQVAAERGDAVAIATPGRRDADGRRVYQTITFAQLEADSTRLAAGLAALGVTPGTRLALLVKPSIDFVSLVFALFKVGAVSVLIDPGMGRKNLLRCLDQVEPEGFVAISIVQAVRVLMGRRYGQAKMNVTVGRRWFWGGPTIDDLRKTDASHFQPVAAAADDPAAIIFTTGSTGPPKGVLFRHEGFYEQVQQIRDRYDIQPGEIDLPGFPLFGLFNSAMGVTSVIPEMDASRPAAVNPLNIIEPIHDWQITQSFASPAVWNKVGLYCEQHEIRLPSLKRVLSAGAPVPPHVLRRMKNAIHADGDIYTPYGATEALPIASIAASEVLDGTELASAQGAGTCVGRRFSGIQWRVIRITDADIATLDQCEAVDEGEIGELIVTGPVVTHRYFTSEAATQAAKIADGERIWHRMGDVGYLDAEDRFWFCGRKAHRVRTIDGDMFTIPCEAIANNHASIFRSALVGVGEPGDQFPVMIVEPWSDKYPQSREAIDALLEEVRQLCAAHPLTETIHDFLLHPAFPVDIRHNAKIFREKLAVWAEERLNEPSQD
ncbi:fatty acid CoA ligase family protein [Blastopirellula marina]|uniref:Peptide synthase n=1 Tax=Blastopirellula marina DSM 3645 TaxID=314230 RepID=A3ZXC2_9BACT|nr:fatty acid CoA ligase family protein [Blastopirellula marina]EAQ78837.1 peptide synthase [Blastopirellula marina DSM 3645]